MKCSKCGTEISKDAKFCSYCGNKIETPQKSFTDKIKEKPFRQWSRLSTYGKFAAVAIVVFVLLFIAALLSGKTVTIIITVFQIVLAVIAILMHRGIIKPEQKKLWLKWLLLGIAALLTVLNIMSYSWSSKAKDQPDSNRISDSFATAVSITAPYGEIDCMGQDYSTIQTAFSTAGFTNIKTEKIEDLQAGDANKVNMIAAISVDGKTDFIKGQEFKPNDEVLIRYHGYTKCSVKIHVDFVSNLMFSKYDVKLLLNGSEKGILMHGENQDFEFSVDPGEYTITFESDESSSVKGEVAVTVDCDIEASYKISCYSDKVSVETLYVDRLKELADGDVKLDVGSSEYRNKKYEDVETALKTLGFTNIKYEVLYDIVLGWTDNGEVESVSIAGKTDFNRGDVFPVDAEIVIVYHMPEEDDPNASTESGQSDDSDSNQPESNETEPNLTVDNCPELAEILTNKAEIDESYDSFAKMYNGRIIEFDGRIDYCAKHGNYDTRFDYLVSAGDYNPDHQIGPTFKFDDVNYYDLNTDLDTLSVGLNVHVAAVVKSFDSSSGLFYLDPVSVTGR